MQLTNDPPAPHPVAVLEEAQRAVGRLSQVPPESLLELARTSVARWVYSTGLTYAFEPFEAEILGFSRGKLLTRMNAAANAQFIFGFSVDGELVWVESNQPTARNYEVQTEPALTVTFQLPLKVAERFRVLRLVSATVRAQSGDRRLCASAAPSGSMGPPWSTREYALDKHGRPITLRIATPKRVLEYLAAYSPLGELTEIRHSGAPSAHWKRPPESARELLSWYGPQLRDALIPIIDYAVEHLDSGIVALVRRGTLSLPPEIAVNSLAAALIMPPNSRFDPHAMVGTVSGRDTPELEISDQRLVETGKMIDDENPEAGAKLLLRIARELTGRKWPSYSPAREIAVYVTDVDAGEFERDFAMCVNRAVRQRLRV